MTDESPSAIGYVVIGFSEPAQVPVIGSELDVIDIEFIHSIHGVASTVPASRVDHSLRALDALDSRLLGQADLDLVAAVIPVGSTAAVVVYAGAPEASVLAGWSRTGATILREGTVDPAALRAARAGLPGANLLGA